MNLAPAQSHFGLSSCGQKKNVLCSGDCNGESDLCKFRSFSGSILGRDQSSGSGIAGNLTSRGQCSCESDKY